MGGAARVEPHSVILEAMAKYDPLRDHLRQLGTDSVTMTFDQVAAMVTGGLPASAYNHQAWWANESSGSHTHARAWLDRLGVRLLPACAPLRWFILLVGEQAQMTYGHVDRGRHRRDVAGGLRQQVAALDSRHEPRSELGHVGVLRNDTFSLKPAKEIFEEFLPSHE
jgi:hypothetical protein